MSTLNTAVTFILCVAILKVDRVCTLSSAVIVHAGAVDMYIYDVE